MLFVEFSCCLVLACLTPCVSCDLAKAGLEEETGATMPPGATVLLPEEATGYCKRKRETIILLKIQ